MSFNAEEYKQKHKKKLNNLKEKSIMVFSHTDFEDTDIVFYYDVCKNRIYSNTYENVKIYKEYYRFFKTKEEVKIYKSVFKSISSMVDEVLMENLEETFSKFVDAKDISTTSILTEFKLPEKDNNHKKYVRDRKVENTEVLWHKGLQV